MNFCKTSNSSFNNQSTFKVNTLDLIDRINNIELYASQVSRIAYQDSQRQLSLEKLAYANQSIIEDLNKIIQIHSQINRYSDVLQVILKMINEYEVISQTYKVLHEQSKQITSKLSINKEIFKRCKLLYKYTQKYFYNSPAVIDIIQQQLKCQKVNAKVRKNIE